MNIEQLPNTYYFWTLPDQNVRDELNECLKGLPPRAALLVTWNTYQEIRQEFSEQLAHREPPDYNCLDMFFLKIEDRHLTVMVTR